MPSSSGRKPCSLISLRPTGAVESASESLLETFSPSACVANKADDKEATAIMTSNDLMLHLWKKSNTLMHDTIHTDPCVMLTYFLATTPEELPGEITACQILFVPPTARLRQNLYRSGDVLLRSRKKHVFIVSDPTPGRLEKSDLPLAQYVWTRAHSVAPREDRLQFASDKSCPCWTVQAPGTSTCTLTNPRCPPCRVRSAWNSTPCWR